MDKRGEESALKSLKSRLTLTGIFTRRRLLAVVGAAAGVFCVLFFACILVNEPLRHYLDGIVSNISVDVLIAIPSLLTGLLVAIMIYNAEDSRSNGLAIDAPATMKYVVGIRRSVAAIFMVTLPILTNSRWSAEISVVLLAVYIAGIIIIATAILRSYEWATALDTEWGNYRTEIRCKYLRSIQGYDLISIWNSVWADEHDVLKKDNQYRLIETFLYDLFVSYDEASPVSAFLVNGFIDAINKNKIYTYNPHIQQLIVKFCDKCSRSNQVNRLYVAECKGDACRILDSLLQKELVKGNDLRANILIRSVAHVVGDASDHGAAFLRTYSDSILSAIYNSDGEFVKYFPDEWLITIDNLRSSKNGDLLRLWLNAYLNLVIPNGAAPNSPNTNNMHAISEWLMPYSDTVLFVELLLTCVGTCGMDDNESIAHARVRELINNRGYIYAFQVGSRSGSSLKCDRRMDSGEDVNNRSETYEIARYVNSVKYTLSNDEYVKDLYAAIKEFEGLELDEAQKATLVDIEEFYCSANTRGGRE